MESKAKALGHPVHPMIVVFPLGLLATAVVFDIIALIQHSYSWYRINFWMIAGGIVGGLVAAAFGLVDWFEIPSGTRAKRIGLYHAGLNTLVVLLFVASWFMRQSNDEVPTSAALVLSFAGALISVFGAWLGGELVYRLGVGIDPGASLNTPNSLTEHPTSRSQDYPTRKAS